MPHGPARWLPSLAGHTRWRRVCLCSQTRPPGPACGLGAAPGVLLGAPSHGSLGHRNRLAAAPLPCDWPSRSDSAPRVPRTSCPWHHRVVRKHQVIPGDKFPTRRASPAPLSPERKRLWDQPPGRAIPALTGARPRCQWAERPGHRGLTTGSVLMCEGRGAPTRIRMLPSSPVPSAPGHRPWQQTPWRQRGNGGGAGQAEAGRVVSSKGHIQRSSSDRKKER